MFFSSGFSFFGLINSLFGLFSAFFGSVGFTVGTMPRATFLLVN